MKEGRSGRLLAVLLAVALSISPAWAEEDEVLSVGEVSWVSGGIGEDSRERLSALEAGFGFNLKVIFALQSGDYLSDVELRIVDAAGKSVLQAKAGGPILLVRLPAGSYELLATADGRVLRQRVKVAEGRLGRSVFRWPLP